jgi:hypothetical protein
MTARAADTAAGSKGAAAGVTGQTRRHTSNIEARRII